MQADKVNECDTEKKMESFTPYMPPEVLQMVFHELDFFDLLRCQQVCKTWRAYLPGNDPKLRDKLFVNRNRTQDSQGGGNDKKNSKIHELHRDLLLGFNLGVKECVEGLGSYTIIPPTVIFPVYAPFWLRINDVSAAIIVHPMVEKLHKYFDIIFGSSFEVGDDRQQRHHKYYTRNDLTAAIEASKKTAKDKNESWKDMLVCVPPLSEIRIGLRFGIRFEVYMNNTEGFSNGATPPSFGDLTESYMHHCRIYAENRGGVTIGQVIDVIHKHLDIWVTD
ncbi:hypothetical protein COCMIDRAFT_29367 [Bipolaris oryzae ATCC 44560]|uniref:F-box domain-containing protein n=1 Tax=Bipolaris oryzae ATCC 44560 TaxID=930090 RepID=W6ZEG5_COCMI|nr:uncharacterized protein COCMIDRAFT_29367 [Bipolaris oryzae ATCC 44560]EUC41916.1 hypothetical protein COCMIDRAFT_29367 [Bipolaris oryzae ATCC 44560]